MNVNPSENTSATHTPVAEKPDAKKPTTDKPGTKKPARRVLIIGATSAIARATAQLFAERGDQLFLIARDEAKLAATAGDLRVRGAAAVQVAAADLDRLEAHPGLLQNALAALGGSLDTVLIAYGTLGDQAACERDFALTQRELHTNFLSVVSLLSELANMLGAQGYGTLAVISSVAGDRGRPSNYVYGTAKGALSLFLQGLRGRLAKAGVSVLTIKPGFVATPMTAGVAKNALFSTPERVARDIVRALDRRREVLYTPGFWWPIMTLIKLIPEPLFKRLKL